MTPTTIPDCNQRVKASFAAAHGYAAGLRLLDLFCCAGGAGEGYRRVGFDVTGVDINPQKNNPHRFIQADALEYLVKVNDLSPTNQALYGAMKAGWIVGHIGGTEDEMDKIFLAVKSGDTNAVLRWLDSKKP